LPASTLILVATPDDVINSVARKLAKSQKGKAAGRTVLHTSGALSQKRWATPRCWFSYRLNAPAGSISDSRSGARSSGRLLCLEGDDEAMRVARRIVRDLGGRSFMIDSTKKALYHAAAVMSSGT